MLSLKLEDDELQQLWQEKLRESLKYRMDQVNFLLVSFFGVECFERFRDESKLVCFRIHIRIKTSPIQLTVIGKSGYSALDKPFIN